jgi:hypothetical protein
MVRVEPLVHAPEADAHQAYGTFSGSAELHNMSTTLPCSRKSAGQWPGGDKGEELGRPMMEKKNRYPSLFSDWGWDIVTLDVVAFLGVGIVMAIFVVFVIHGTAAGIAVVAIAIGAYVLARRAIRARSRKKTQRYARELFR